MNTETYQITEEDAGRRLDRSLRRVLGQNILQSRIEKLCRLGLIRVDGKRADPATRPETGQIIHYPPLSAFQDQESAVKPRQIVRLNEGEIKDFKKLIIYQDKNIIVLNKPAGLAVQGGPGVKKHIDGMLGYLQEEGQDRPRLVHRLDKDTSGVLILARTVKTASFLSAAFQQRRVKKIYRAAVYGRPEGTEGKIDLPLKREVKKTGGTSYAGKANQEGFLSAVTYFKVSDAVGKRFALLELIPQTGRTHQLRIHCAEGLGTPILGDVLYGGMQELPEEVEPLLHLHAAVLEFPHPEKGYMRLEAPLPRHMMATFKALGFEIGKKRS